MSGKKFKVGDRARVIHDGWDDNDTPVACGTFGVVADIIGNSVTIKTDRPLTYSVDIDEVELISPTNPCTAFLQELKELLDKYSADIWADGGWDGCCLHLELDNEREKFNVKGENLLHGKPIELEDYSEM